jgi:hypothetical protein
VLASATVLSPAPVPLVAGAGMVMVELLVPGAQPWVDPGAR